MVFSQRQNTILRRRAEIYAEGLKVRANSVFRSYNLEEIQFDKNDIVIDVGANTGDLKLFFEYNKYEIEYHAFEPGNIEYECLKMNLPNEVFLSKEALSDFEGETKLYVHPGLASNSIIETPFYQRVRIIKTRKLNTYHVSGKVKLVKIDAEGAEPEVLRGSQLFLKNVLYVSIDVGKERGLNEEDTESACVELMENYGFSIKARNHRHRHTILFINQSM